ncbi:unnamed protein product [Ilex paraguariensis]|uniref:BRF2-like C-terminal domain-containing protein n=1 Tax=Ilex paraguariensis TaxID=185542 RepID=A0ABC8RT23_9AQUA
MESSRPCKYCRERTIVPDEVTGNLVCESCGGVQEYENYQAHVGGITGPAGTYVRTGTAGSGSVYNYKETKIYEAKKLIEDFMFRLGISGPKSNEVKVLVETITEGEYGTGNWFPILVGACAYVVMRKDNKTLPLVEISAVIGREIYELGRMVDRVVSFVDLKLPEFDIVNSFERAIRTCPSFSDVSEDKTGRMVKQGIFLMNCLVKWFLTTGRRPMPVVVAVLVFVAELNQVEVNIEVVAKELHVAVVTCRLRYKELLERLVRVAKLLPWGKDITVKNVVKNAPFVIQYMELKSMSKRGEKRKALEDGGFDLDELVGDCLSNETGYRIDSYGTKIDSQYFELEHSPQLSVDDMEKFKISHECLYLIYSKFLNEFSNAKSTIDGKDNRRKRSRGYDFLECTEWWKGKSELSKKLFLKQILEKDVGLNATPPSFDRGCLAYQRRREKIKAAKLRIEKVMCPSNAGCDGLELDHLESTCAGKKKQRKMQVEIDWEDFIIEALLLHQVKEEEIQKGHYNALLDLYVFDSGSCE